jgi:hypothetical protein
MVMQPFLPERVDAFSGSGMTGVLGTEGLEGPQSVSERQPEKALRELVVPSEAVLKIGGIAGEGFEREDDNANDR